MIKRKIYIYLLFAAIMPALAVTLPTPKARAENGRNAAFAAGLAAGAIGGAAIVSSSRNAPPRRYYHPAPPPPPRYYRPAPPRYYRPAPPPPVRYYGRPAPWTSAWYAYCHSKYRSFDSRTGYYTTYSGRKRFCR
nr:BA14K family protein [uncultured Cohaesibacter sp.]